MTPLGQEDADVAAERPGRLRQRGVPSHHASLPSPTPPLRAPSRPPASLPLPRPPCPSSLAPTLSSPASLILFCPAETPCDIELRQQVNSSLNLHGVVFLGRALRNHTCQRYAA